VSSSAQRPYLSGSFELKDENIFQHVINLMGADFTFEHLLHESPKNNNRGDMRK